MGILKRPDLIIIVALLSVSFQMIHLYSMRFQIIPPNVVCPSNHHCLLTVYFVFNLFSEHST